MEEGGRPLFDVQTLTVVVRQKESLQDLLRDPLLYQTNHHFIQVLLAHFCLRCFNGLGTEMIKQRKLCFEY